MFHYSIDSIPLAILETNTFVLYQPFTLPRFEFLLDRKKWNLHRPWALTETIWIYNDQSQV